MASSRNSDSQPTSRGRDGSGAFSDRARSRGYRGGVIAMHRALARLVLTRFDRIAAALLVLLFSVLWLVALPQLCRFWRAVLSYGIHSLALQINLGLSEHHLTRFIRFDTPYPQMTGLTPSTPMWWWTAAVVLALFAASYLFTEKFTPVKYLLRAVLAVQASALLFFVWAPARFPHTPDG